MQWHLLSWSAGLAAPERVGSSQTRDQTRVPSIGRQILFFFFKHFISLLIFGRAASLLLCWLSLVIVSRGLLFIAVCGLRIAVASLATEHRRTDLVAPWLAGSSQNRD